jgi:predicted permease
MHRLLTKTPGHSFMVVALLALGLGATTAVFSLVNAVILRPLRALDADRLVRSVTVDHGAWLDVADSKTLTVWRQHPELFEDVSAYRLELANLTGGTRPEQVATARVSDTFFHLFGASFVAGRGFTRAEDAVNGPAVAVLSDALWIRRFGRDPHVIGRTITLGEVPHLVVGVVAPGFDTEQFDAPPDVWVPLQADADAETGGNLFDVAARLRPGVSTTQADAVLRVAYAAFQASNAARADPSVATWIAAPLREAIVHAVRPLLRLLLGAVGCLLALTCANVMNLLLLSGEARRGEIAIRTALGASRARLVRQLTGESAMLSCAGGAIGIVAGPAAMRALLRLYPASNPFILLGAGATIPRLGAAASAIAVDHRVMLFAAAVSVLTGIGCGIVPALRVTRHNINALLQRTNAKGSERGRGRNTIVVAEVALAAVLVLGAMLFVRSARALAAVDPGFHADHVLTLRMSVADGAFASTDGVARLQRAGVAAIERVPGVVDASLACCMPLETVWQMPVVVQSRAGEGLRVSGRLRFHGFAGWTFVSPGYLDVLRIPLRRGRGFSDRDTAGAPPVAIINEAMARRYWPGSDPLQDRIAIGRGMDPAFDSEPVRQVVGIVADVRDTNLMTPPRPIVYVPAAQLPPRVISMTTKLLPLTWMVRTRDDPHARSRDIQTALEQVSGLPAARVRAMDEVVAASTARPRLRAWVMATCGIAALLIAAFGIYSVMAFWVHQRTRDIGVRLAIGAAPGRIASGVMIHGMYLAAPGIAAGAIAAFLGARFIAALLFGVHANDPLAFGVAGAVLLLVAVAAVGIPALRAARIDPLILLRTE